MKDTFSTSDNSPSRSLVIANAGALPATLGPELEEAAGYARAEKAAATRRAYRSDFALFRSWCETKRISALPAAPETVAAFLAAEANRGTKTSTIGRRLAAIRYAHKIAGHEPPTNSEAVKATLRGIRRTVGSTPARKVPATADKILAMAERAGTDIKGLRDRALLLLGFAGAFRRSELVALDTSTLQFCDDGLTSDHSQKQNRSGRPWRYDCNCTRLDRLPGRSGARLDQGSGHC